jgi:enediyne biosynthesis protein E4
MGSGVALFDYDNDGLLDLYLLDGARIDDPATPGTIPKKDGPQYWNRLYHQNQDGTFQDVTITTASRICTSRLTDRTALYHNNGNGTFTDVRLKLG